MFLLGLSHPTPTCGCVLKATGGTPMVDFMQDGPESTRNTGLLLAQRRRSNV